MSMNNVSPSITICEVCRQLNDLHQSNSEHDIEVRKKLASIEFMAKRMVTKLAEYKNIKELKRELFTETNHDYDELKALRKSSSYKVENVEISDDEMGGDIQSAPQR